LAPSYFTIYAPTDGFTALNMSYFNRLIILGASVLPLSEMCFAACAMVNPSPWTTLGIRQLPEADDQLPRPQHNFTELPRIRSERPAVKLRYP
jgi:hypothetical protein